MFVCRSCKGRAALLGRLDDAADVDVRLVRCQKICHGPVVGATVGGKLEWFERMSKPKRVKALVKAVAREKRKVPDRLQPVRVTKRSGTGPR